MKKIFSLLTLLVCFVGAHAAATTVYERTLATWVSTDVGTGAWVGNATVDNDKGLYVSGNGNRSAVLTFSHTDFSIQTYDIEFNNAGNTGNNNNYSYVDIGNNLRIRSNQQAQNGHVIINGVENAISNCNKKNVNRGGDVWTIHIEINTATNMVTALTLSGDVGGDNAASFTLAEPASLGSNATYNTVTLGTNRAAGSPAAGIKAIKIAEEEQDLSTAPYTINYQLSGTTVKTESGTAAIETSVNATGPFTVDNQKYYIVDGAQTEFAVAISGNTFNVPVRKAYEYSYTVNAVAGSQSQEIAKSTCVEGESVSVPYPKFVNVNGTLFQTTKQSSNPWWAVNIAPTTNNFVHNINYTQAATGISFFSEAENLPGATAVTTGNANIRCSMAAGGYFAGDDKTVTTLQPGVYKLFTSVWGNAGTTLTFKAGEETILEAETKGYIMDYTSEEFIISAATDITMTGGAAGNAPKIADYVYIQKTANYVASESIAIGEAALEIGKSAVMTAAITPANASRQKLTWSIVEGGMAAKGLNLVAEEDGEAEIDAETGALTPKKAGNIWVRVTNGEVDDYKQFYINPAVFAVTFTDAPEEGTQVFVGGENGDQSEGETLNVTTKAGFDDMQNTTRLQPKGNVTATEIPTYIYSIAVDKSKKTIGVTYERDIEVTAMEFAVAEQRIAQGNSRTMKVTYYPANASFKTAKWTSSNPEVATVDENTGYVKAVGEGTTTITAEWAENESHGTDYSAQMTLTVDKGLVLNNIVYDEMEDGTAEVMGYYFPLPSDTLYLPSKIESNGRMIPVTFIDQEAFIGCNLKCIVLPGTVKTIDHRAIEYSNNHNAYNEQPEEGLESAFLMEGVEVMRDRIFFGNKYMKKVFLPSTLKEIGYYSFDDTAIEDVYYGGTEKQWKELDSLTNARYGEGAISFSKLPENVKIHFNSTYIGAMLSGVSVEEDFVKLDAGEEYQIEVTVAPEQIASQVSLTFTSSNEEIATVDKNGVITAVADGLATITVSAGGQEAQVKVQVGDVRDYTTPLVTTWSVQGGSNPVKGVFTDEETHYYNFWGNSEAGWFAQAYAQFDLSNLRSTDDFKAKFTVWVNCARGTRTFDVYGLPAGSKKEDYQVLVGKQGVELATYSDITTTYVAKEIDVTEYIKGILAEGGSDAIIIMSNGAAGGNIYGKGSAEFAPTLNIYPANGDNSQLTGISEAQADKTVKSGKYFEKGQVVIYINGKKFNAAGQQVK